MCPSICGLLNTYNHNLIKILSVRRTSLSGATNHLSIIDFSHPIAYLPPYSERLGSSVRLRLGVNGGTELPFQIQTQPHALHRSRRVGVGGNMNRRYSLTCFIPIILLITCSISSWAQAAPSTFCQWSGDWSNTANMSQSRAGATATLLTTGPN